MGRYARSRRRFSLPVRGLRTVWRGGRPCEGIKPGDMRPKPSLRRHLESVSKLAAGLARRHGADPFSAGLAGLLHDILKDCPRSRLAKIMRGCGVRLDPSTRRTPSLWHGPAAAGLARACLGIRSAGVLKAVHWHSTGRPRSDVLGEIVFIADYCSFDRDFREAAVGRRLARRNLSMAARYVTASKLAHLGARGIAPHPAALAHWRGLLG